MQQEEVYQSYQAENDHSDQSCLDEDIRGFKVKLNCMKAFILVGMSEGSIPSSGATSASKFSGVTTDISHWI